MMPTLYERYYERQPGAVKVIAVAGLGLLGYSLYRSIQRKREERQAAEAAAQAERELNELAATGVYPSYQLSQFEVFVNTLVQSMTGCATDEEAVYSVFRSMRNDADIRQLIKSFGIQYYQPCSWTSPVSYAIWQFNDKAYGGDLATWLSYDLSDSEKRQVNDALSDNGVNYQF